MNRDELVHEIRETLFCHKNLTAYCDHVARGHSGASDEDINESDNLKGTEYWSVYAQVQTAIINLVAADLSIALPESIPIEHEWDIPN